MSLVEFRSGSLSIAPHVATGSGWLFARTGRLWTTLSLGAYRRELHVDTNRRRLTLRARNWWMTSSRELRFDEIDHIAYRFAPLTTAFVSSYRAGRATLEPSDSWELFQIELVLRDGSQLPLFTFSGQGAVMTGPLGVVLGDDLVDAAGRQENESLHFVQELLRTTGLSLTPRAHTLMLERLGAVCPGCGHHTPPRDKCLYCGAKLAMG